MWCLLGVTGRQLLRPAMGGSKSTRSKETYNKTVSKAELNGKIDINVTSFFSISYHSNLRLISNMGHSGPVQPFSYINVYYNK